MLIVSQGTTRFSHQGVCFTSQYAPVGWGFVKICNDVKSNPHLGPGWGVGISIDKCINSRLQIGAGALHVHYCPEAVTHNTCNS